MASSSFASASAADSATRLSEARRPNASTKRRPNPYPSRMGKANRTNRAIDRAAEMRARAEHKRQAYLAMVPHAPIWEYPSMTESSSYGRDLDALLDHTVRVARHNQGAGYLHPASAAAELGLSGEQFVAAYTRLHEHGLLIWDAELRVHRHTPTATDEAIEAAIASLGHDPA